MPPASVTLFGDPRSFISTVLVDAALREARTRPDVEIAAVCDAGRGPGPGRLPAAVRLVLASLVRRLFDPAHPIVLHRPMLWSLEGVARRAGVAYVVPPQGDVNHPGFVARLRENLRPAFALSLAGLQVFRPPLLGVFERAVNYHNGLLPGYRGLRATAWSLYHRETVTGFTFHAMTEELDGGPILVQEGFSVRPGASPLQVEWEKTVRAAVSVGRVLDVLLRGEPVREQVGSPSYFGWRELRAIRTIDEPAAHTWDELERRLAAFGLLKLRLGGAVYEVTRLRRLGEGARDGSGLRFTTVDGVVAEPWRFEYLPLALHRVHRGPSRGRGGR